MPVLQLLQDRLIGHSDCHACGVVSHIHTLNDFFSDTYLLLLPWLRQTHR
jgi:hypothetical protein